MIRYAHPLIAAGALAVLLFAGSANASVIAHWTFEEGTPGQPASGTDSVLDVAGTNHGTPFNSPVYVADGADTGLDFNGINQGVSLPDDPATFSLTALTVEAVVNIEALGGLRQIVFRGDSAGGDDPFYLAVFNNGIRWLVEGPDDGAAAIDLPSITTGERLHIAGTIDGATDTMNLYVNGTLAGTRTTDRTPNFPIGGSARIGIGMLDDGATRRNDQFFDGQIYAIRISDEALTPDRFLTASQVPAPASLALFAAGVLGVGAIRRRR